MADTPTEFELRPLRILSADSGLFVGFALLSSLIRQPNASGPAGWPSYGVPAAVGGVAILIICVVSLAGRLHARRRPIAIVVSADTITLPLPPPGASRRAAIVPLRQVRSVVRYGGILTGRLVIDAGARQFTYRLRRFTMDDPGAAIAAEVSRRLAELGETACEGAFAERNALGMRLARQRPWACWSAAAVLTLIFLWQRCWATPGLLSIADQGANVPVLIGDGQWFRLITANLLHMNATHLAGNCLVLLVIGSVAERLLGWRLFLLVLLASGIAAQLASWQGGRFAGGHIVSLGASGAIFGLIGAVAAVVLRLGKTLPGGLRLPGRALFGLILASGLLLPLVTKRTDIWAHGGGAVAGFCFAFALCRRADSVDTLGRPAPWQQPVLAFLCGICLLAPVAASVHAKDPARLAADHLALARRVSGDLAYSPAVRVSLAMSIEARDDAGAELVQEGRVIARQAVASLDGAGAPGLLPGFPLQPGQKKALRFWAGDALAVLTARAGDPQAAAEGVAKLAWRSQPMGTHFALILDRLLEDQPNRVAQRHGTLLLGTGDVPVPRIALDRGTIRLTLDAPAPAGGRVYALLKSPRGIEGVLFFRLPAGFSGTRILPLPPSFGAPATRAPDPVWLDATSQIDVAIFDRSGCACDGEPYMGPYFAAFDRKALVPL